MPRSGRSTKTNRRRPTDRHDAGLTDEDKGPAKAEEKTLSIDIPLRTVSASNINEHWAARYARSKRERLMLKFYLNGREPPKLPCEVTVTRIAPRSLDVDNLGASLKTVIDTVAAWITPGLAPGRADSVKGFKVYMDQHKGKPNEFAVNVTINEL